MYKGILDSGWVEAVPLTVIVGKNEAGKTSLLRALHKLNPKSPMPYDINREWPRGHRDMKSKDQVVCTARFALSEDRAGGGHVSTAAYGGWPSAPVPHWQRLGS
jgi:hypothetical protein